ncbi:MAG: protein jag [Dehalococcoidia bacterium]|nr:protein jag [Dehalococcoidia bacterium]MDD5495061.1 protein jag [Dehalococcoidia bacterium]
MKELEVSAKNVEEATRVALEQLGVSRDKVEIIVVKKGKSGVLGMGAEDAKIKVILLDEGIFSAEGTANVDEIARQVLGELLNIMDIEATVSINKTNDSDTPMVLNIEGEELGVLIGRRGQALSSLQYLVRLIVSEKAKKWVSINVDVDWYKKRHYDSLKNLAYRLAEQVTKRKRPITMEPMPPDERRIIHITLADHPEVTTQSTGEGDGRRVVIQSRKR